MMALMTTSADSSGFTLSGFHAESVYRIRADPAVATLATFFGHL
jgi:hypothetical protein